jgi:hypothetical protein
MFELGDQPSGMGFVIASAVPIGAQVVARLVAFQHPVGRNQDGVRDRDLSPAHPSPFHQLGVLDRQIVLAVHPAH